MWIINVNFPILVPRIESDDHATVPGQGRRGEGVRVGAQVTGPGANASAGAQALRGGDASRTGISRVTVPKGTDGCRGFGAESHEIDREV